VIPFVPNGNALNPWSGTAVRLPLPALVLKIRFFLILFLNRNGNPCRMCFCKQRNGETNRELSGSPVLAMEGCRITVGLAGVSGSTRLRTLRGSRHSGCSGA